MQATGPLLVLAVSSLSLVSVEVLPLSTELSLEVESFFTSVVCWSCPGLEFSDTGSFASDDVELLSQAVKAKDAANAIARSLSFIRNPL